MTSKILTSWWVAAVAAVAAVAFGVLTLGLDLAVVPLDILTHKTGPGGAVADGLSTAAVVVPAVAVGTLLAARRPRNPIGWVLLAILGALCGRERSAELKFEELELPLAESQRSSIGRLRSHAADRPHSGRFGGLLRCRATLARHWYCYSQSAFWRAYSTTSISSAPARPGQD
jgi:hypothetical protein